MKTRKLLVLLVCLSLIFILASCDLFDTLKDVRAEAVAQVEALAKDEAYASLDEAAVTKIVETAKNNITAAKTEEGIAKAVENARASLEKLVLDGVKADAKAELKAYLDLSLYSDANKTLINGKIADASAAIDNCADADAVLVKLAEAKAALDEIKPALDEAKEGACASLDSYVDLALYSEANKALIEAEIAAAKAEINGLGTVEAVAERLNAAKATIDALPTALEEAKAAAVAAVEGYIADKSAYSDQGVAKIERIIRDAKENIETMTDEAVIAVIVEDAKSDLDAVLTLAEEYGAKAQALKDSMTSVVGEVVENNVRVEGGSIIIDTAQRDGTTLYFGKQDGNTAVVLDTLLTIDYRNNDWSEITIRFRSWDESNNYNVVIKHGSTLFNKTKWENGGKNTVLLTRGSSGVQHGKQVHLQIISWGWTKKVLIDGECVFSIEENDFNVGRIYIETWQAGVTLTNPTYIEYASDAELEADYAEELAKACINKSEAELLNEAKTEAKNNLATYWQEVKANYSEANQAIVEGYFATIISTVDGCKSVAEVNGVVADAMAEFYKIPTIEEEAALAESKADAKAEIAAYLSDVEAKYSADGQALIAQILAAGNAAIDECVDKASVREVVTVVKQRLDGVPTLEDENNAELMEKKTAAIAEIKAHLQNVEATYSEANQKEIAKILTDGELAIASCESVDAVDAAVSSIKAALDAIFTVEEEKINEQNAALTAFKSSLTNVSGDLIGLMSVADGQLTVDSKVAGLGGNFRFGNQDGNMNKVFDAKLTINYNSEEWSKVTIRFCAWDASTNFKMEIQHNSIKIFYCAWGHEDLLLVEHNKGIENGKEVHLQILTKGWTKMVVIDGVCIFKYWPNTYHVGYTMIETWESGLVIRDAIYKEYSTEDEIGAEYGDVVAKESVNALINEIK